MQTELQQLGEPLVGGAPARRTWLTSNKLKVAVVALCAISAALAVALAVVSTQQSSDSRPRAEQPMTNVAQTLYLSQPPKPMTSARAAPSQGLRGLGPSAIVGLAGDIVNVGTKVWSLVQNSEAQVTTSLPSANAIPQGVSVSQLAFPVTSSHWSQQHQIVFPGALFGTYASFTFKMEYQCGGTYQGKGAYLANVQPNDSDYAAYGQTLTVTMNLESPTYSSSDVAVLSGTITATDKGFSSTTKTCSFVLYGDCSTPTFNC
mmetsp:Transcript_34093/g.77844  ORF Transcript_34093/g.77844 Transcript_34093/m.77844 type:complete len:261 (+) Transcript_34093:35-817(+)|eukprot:CAMPEP_0114553792 /NCGR_PEP_ID=MMETSP0114-20121206/7858_1 /TAXON_ID=31324 /ORGANISM="Goniomonas sp, Strain m" /LENGTH=260 /DNA_ID=CAMNT_0001738781 /DNA_START=14 /DNA_END=796 /DNA_ORIENTATION=-